MPTITAPPPPEFDDRVLPRVAADLRSEHRARSHGGLPAGSHRPSIRHTHLTLADPLRLLLDHERRFGPVFTIRHLHATVVWAVGAEVNHQILVSDADAFSWREGRFSDLHPLLGDGMLNIDGDYHRQMRRLMLPAFHREQVAGVGAVMVEEAVRATEALRPGARVDLYAWTRELALRIALRGLLGIEATGDRAHRLADAFERALGFYGRSFFLQVLRGPATPYARMRRARGILDAVVLEEIRERRRRGEPGAGVLGMLLAATGADGRPLPETAVRDQAVTLLFAGHDTTTATVTFLAYELGRAPAARAALEEELDTVLGDRDPEPHELDGKALPVLERTLMETLRRYPAAWVGPRRTVREVELGGVRIPSDVAVHYSSWATHHLPALWPDPLAFEPDRFRPDRLAAIPRGAYIPFGGGSRMCLGKRFGEQEIRAIAAVVLRRVRLVPGAGDGLRVAVTPTLGPVGGLCFDVVAR